MKDKTQYEALMEELQKIVENFRVGVTEIGERFAKLLPDIEIYEEEEEDTWEMKCPYEVGDEYYYVYGDGCVHCESWENLSMEISRWHSGNIFPTKEAAELEAKRRNLLTRFRAFRDECNNGWKPDWKNAYENKLFICKVDSELEVYVSSIGNSFAMFGYFKNEQDAERAIDLFGDEIKELFVECD